MYNVLHAVDAKLAEVLRNGLVVVDRDPALVDLAIAPLVDELADSLQRRVAISDIWLHVLEHLENGLVDLEEDAVVELLQSQELQNLTRLRAELDNADNARHEE